ncbi:MAG: hypothetical protein PHG44_09615 [Lentisphaeria bacterium]|nr:hypothetical protein [Lentisphaeria bacterium]MDY0177323.1 hypothetical protein [Lentisphaeria bacterium]
MLNRVFFIFCNIVILSSLCASNFTVSANVAGRQVKEDSYQFTFSQTEGGTWIKFNLPANCGWGEGQTELSITLLNPDVLTFRLAVEAVAPDNALRKSGFANLELSKAESRRLSFKQAGNKPPQQLYIYSDEAIKSPFTIEISQIKVGDTQIRSSMNWVQNAGVEALPAILFKGKPFFPLGAYDYRPVGGDSASIDPDFLAAGGNITDFGNLSVPSWEGYEKYAQPAIFEKLEKIKEDPQFDNVALLIGLGFNLVMDDSKETSGKFGLGSYMIPASGESLALRSKILSDAVRKLSKYENVIGYTMDEPENLLWPYYSEQRKKEWELYKDQDLASCMLEWINSWTKPIIREHHPGAQLMPIIAWWTTYKQTADMYDVLIANSYPGKTARNIEFESDLFSVSYDAAMQVAAVRANGGGRSAIYMPPMYDILGDKAQYTINEQLYVMFAPIAQGVMGVHGWRLQRCSAAYRKFVIYPAMKEVSRLSEFFLGEWHNELVSSDHDDATVEYLQKFKERERLVEGLEDAENKKALALVPDVSHCLRRHADGRYLLLIVNNRREPLPEVRFKLWLEKLPRKMTCNINHSRTVWFSKDGEFKTALKPFEVQAYVFNAR